MSRPLRLLFVCTANICRSPFMELYTRDLAGDRLVVSSAGTYGFAAREMSPEMAAELDTRGISATEFRSRTVSAALLEEADLVLTAERTHRQFILDDHPQHFRKVLTVGQALAALDDVPDHVRGRAFVQALAERRGSARSAGDIDDPYGRGAAAAAASATIITGMLERLVPRLVEDTDQEEAGRG